MAGINNSTQTEELLHPTQITARQWVILLLGVLASMIEGFDILVAAYTAPAISKDWNVSSQQMGFVLSAGVFGMTLGAMFLSWVADRYGRRIAVSSSQVIAGLATCAVMLASTPTELVILRAIAGLALGVLVASLTPLMGEFSPQRHRILIVSVMVAAAAAGAVIGGLATAAVLASYGWQSVFLCAGALTVVLGVLTQVLVPESIAFVIKRDPEHALERVNHILRAIGQTPVQSLPRLNEAARAESASVASLLVSSRRRATMLSWSAFFAGFVVVYFISSWMPQVLSNAGLSHANAIQGTTAIPLGSIIGTMLMGWLARWYALNHLIAGGFVVGMFCIFGLGAIVRDISAVPFPLVLVTLFMVGITLMGAFSNLYNVALTIYPAQIRSTGLGWSAGLGRAGAVISPLLAGLLMGAGMSMPVLFVAFSVPALVAAFCVGLIRMRELT